MHCTRIAASSSSLSIHLRLLPLPSPFATRHPPRVLPSPLHSADPATARDTARLWATHTCVSHSTRLAGWPYPLSSDLLGLAHPPNATFRFRPSANIDSPASPRLATFPESLSITCFRYRLEPDFHLNSDIICPSSCSDAARRRDKSIALSLAPLYRTTPRRTVQERSTRLLHTSCHPHRRLPPLATRHVKKRDGSHPPQRTPPLQYLRPLVSLFDPL